MNKVFVSLKQLEFIDTAVDGFSNYIFFLLFNITVLITPATSWITSTCHSSKIPGLPGLSAN